MGKLASEEYLRIYEQFGIRSTSLRLFNIYGPGQNMANLQQGMVSIFLAQMLKDRHILVKGGKERYRDFIYIDDAVSAIVLLTDNVYAGASQAEEHYFNCQVGSGEAVTIREFAELAKSIAESETMLAFGAVPYRENEIMFCQADTSVLKEMGWAPSFTLEEGIRRTVEAEKDHLTGANL